MLIDNASLSSSLPLLRNGRATRHPAAPLTGFYLEGRGNHIALVSSNQFSETSCLIAAEEANDTAIAIPVEFADIVEKSASAPVKLKLTAKRAEIVIGTTKVRLQFQPGEVFPRLVMGKAGQTMKIAPTPLKKALDDTMPFAPTGHVKAALNGVLLIMQPDRITCVGTNGHTMAVSSAAVSVATADPIQRILPTACLRQLRKVLDMGEEVTITIAENAIEFKCGAAALIVKPIQEKYPDWKKLMTPQPLNTVTVAKASLASALSRAGVFADARTPCARFQIGQDGLLVTSASKASDIGEAADIVPIITDGPIHPKQFAANLVYMNAATAAITTAEIRLSYSDVDRTAVWFRKVGLNADDSVVIVNPMTL